MRGNATAPCVCVSRISRAGGASPGVCSCMPTSWQPGCALVLLLFKLKLGGPMAPDIGTIHLRLSRVARLALSACVACAHFRMALVPGRCARRAGSLCGPTADCVTRAAFPCHAVSLWPETSGDEPANSVRLTRAWRAPPTQRLRLAVLWLHKPAAAAIWPAALARQRINPSEDPFCESSE